MKRLTLIVMICLVAATMLFANGQKESSDGPIELTYSTWMTKGEDAIWVDAFNASQDEIVVKMEMLEGAKYPELIRTRVLSNDMPDVMLLMDTQVMEYSREGYLADVTDTSVADLQARTPMAADFNTRDGRVYATDVSGGIDGYMWYNKKLFSDLGISAPQTMDEFWAACEVLKDAGNDPILIGGADTWTYKMIRFAAFSLVVDPAFRATGHLDLGEALYNGADVEDVYRGLGELYKKMIDEEYLVKASMTTTWPQSSQLFADGNVGFFPQGPWMPGLPEIVNADPDVFELGVIAMPVEGVEGDRYLKAGLARLMAVSAESENLDAAMKFFEFVTAEDQLISYLETHGLTTMLDLTYDLPAPILEFKDIVNSQEIQPVPLVFPQPAGFSQATDTFGKNIHAGATVDEALAELKAYYLDGRDRIKF